MLEPAFCEGEASADQPACSATFVVFSDPVFLLFEMEAQIVTDPAPPADRSQLAYRLIHFKKEHYSASTPVECQKKKPGA
jgi:hypothetical protein